MPKKVTPLTNTQTKQAKPREKEYNLSDGDGLMLRIKPSGTRLWLFNYSHPYTKKRTNISFGRYPTVSLKFARQKRQEAMELLKQGIDPKQAKEEKQREEEEKHSNTLEHVAGRWFTIKQTTITPDYADDLWRSLRLHVFPRLGKYPLHEITAPITIRAIEPLAKKGKNETVKRVCQRLNEIMIFAVNTGLIHHNPLTGIKENFVSPEKKRMPTIPPEELPEFLHDLQNASIHETTRNLILWQLHTMVRPNEAAGAMWEEIDTEQALWNIPAERMKKKRPHTIPLTPQALAILETMRPFTGHRKYIFASHIYPDRPSNSSTANMAIKVRMGYKGRLVAHGLRALASTILNEQGFNGDLVEAALAHVEPNETRRAYNRAKYIEKRRPMMAWWSKHIQQ